MPPNPETRRPRSTGTGLRSRSPATSTGRGRHPSWQIRTPCRPAGEPALQRHSGKKTDLPGDEAASGSAVEAGSVESPGARDVAEHGFALTRCPVVRVLARRLLQAVEPLQRPPGRRARAARTAGHGDVDRAGGRVGMDVEDVLVALFAPGTHEEPSALARADPAGEVGGHGVQIVPCRDLAVPDHFE